MKLIDRFRDVKLMKKILMVGVILFGIGVIGASVTFAAAGEKIADVQSGSSTFSDEVSSIYMELYSEDVEIKAEDRDDVFIEYKAIPKEYIPSVSGANGELKIVQKNRLKVGFDLQFIGFLKNGFQNSQITITVPQKLYNKIEIKSGLGDTEIFGLEVDTLIVKANMGSTNITASGDKVEIDSKMGEVTFTSTKENAKSIVLSAGMGDATVNNADFARYDFDISMGNIDVDGLNGTGKINANMGTIKVNVKKWTGDMKLTANMGDIDVSLPKGSGAVVEADANLGNISVHLGGLDSKNFNGTASFNGDGMYKLEVEADMGDVEISD